MLALVAIGVLVTAGFVLAERESRVARFAEGRTVSLYLAERGLAELMTDWRDSFDALDPWRSAEVRGEGEGGEWSVRVTRMSPDLFFLVSRGRARGEAGDGGPDGGRRGVGMVDRRTAVRLDPGAALATREPPPRAGWGIEADPEDRIPPGWGPVCGTAEPGAGPEVRAAPIALYDGRWELLRGLAERELRTPLPPGRPAPTLEDGACDVNDSLNWGDPDRPRGPCGGYFPVVYVRGDAELTDEAVGQGILLVDGDLTMGGSARFRGLVLVRGVFRTSDGAPEVSGAVVAHRVGESAGTPRLSYSGCALERAGLTSGALVRIRPLERRSWIDLTGLGG